MSKRSASFSVIFQLLLAATLAAAVAGSGCPGNIGDLLGPPDGGSGSGTGGSGSGDVDAGDDASGAGDVGDGGSTDGDDTTGSTGDGSSDGSTDGTGSDDDGFTQAVIIHRGAGGFLADATVGIPTGADFSTSSGIQTSVQLTHVTKDGSRVWFATQDGNGFVTPQLFCIETDGTGIQEFTFPSGLVKLPAALWPSANGDTCTLIIDACGDGGCSGYLNTNSVILLASRAAGTVTILFDARNIEDGENDYFNLQMTDDGSTILFEGWDTGVIYTLPSSGGTPQAFIAPASFTRASSIPQRPQKWRINDDASALLAVVRFEGPENTYPQDVYLVENGSVTAITNSGDAFASSYHNDLGVSDDGHYLAYARYLSDQRQYRVEVVDRTAGTTTTIIQGASGHATLLDPNGTLIFTGYRAGSPVGNHDQLPGLGTLDNSSALELHDTWLNHYAAPVSVTSMSRGGQVLVGTWDNGAFGDPDRLYAWFPGTTSFRGGPSISSVSYKLDSSAGTLTVRATVSGTATSVNMFGFYENFESVLQLPESQDPFYTERFGQALTASSDDASVYEYTVDLDGISLDSDFRVRVGAGDDEGKNFAYVDFRPVPIADETLDTNGDGVGD